MPCMNEAKPDSVSAALAAHIERGILAAGGWVPFDRFMVWALYAPGLGYYARGSRQFGLMPATGTPEPGGLDWFEANAKGLPDADMVNSAMVAELEGLRAQRAAERAEIDEVLATLEPLLKEA